MLHVAVALVCAVIAPQGPYKLGVVAVETAEVDPAFVRGVRRAVDGQNQKGGIDGRQVEVVLAAALQPTEVPAALATLQAAGVVGIVAPLEPSLAEPLRKAAAGKVPVAGFAPTSADTLPYLDRLLLHHWCFTRVGFVRDGSKDAKELGKQLAKALTAPAAVLLEFETTITAKALAKLYEDGRPEVLLIDADPTAAARLLSTVLAGDRTPVLLTPRTFGAPVQQLEREVFVVHGLSPACTATTSAFRSEYERDHGTPGLGAGEGFEATMALLRALDAADGSDPAKVQAALATQVLEGVRGRGTFDAKLGAFTTPLGVWQCGGKGHRAQPYVPGVVPLRAVGESAGTAPAEDRKPQAQVGDPFGTWRTRQFVPEEGAQWVLCDWATDGGFATGGDDLKQLGLSTDGADPIVDHLVREELLARVLAIVSPKFGRKPDGSGVAGKSLRIAFTRHLTPKEREKKKQRLWPAWFGGDHADAGGEAFGTFCRVYSTFIRRTIFQPHALTPPVTTADREFLDGTYRFGSDYAKDKRSELIRALINGYAGSMALTLAHEVGHLAGLDHVTDDPVEIMNVNEGGGIDYREAHFGAGSFEKMRERYGLTGDKPGKGDKAKGR